MKWLITGGCGFIGTNLIRELLKAETNTVRIVDNLSVGTRDDLRSVTEFQELVSRTSDQKPPACQLVEGDILDEDLAVALTRDVDVIVHLAANTGVAPSVENPRKDCLMNVIGTLNYLEAARINKVSRFVFASSGAPVGEVTPPIHEEMAPHPVSPYGASKLAGEGYCSAYFRTFGIETVALRFGNVYGPGSIHKSSVVGKFIRQTLNRETLEIYGNGTQTRDFIYVTDLVNAIILAGTKTGVGGETFQIATHSETTLNELVEMMQEAFKAAGKSMPDAIYTEPRLGDVKRNFSDTSKAKQMLGWQQSTSLPQGLKKTIDWFLARP